MNVVKKIIDSIILLSIIFAVGISFLGGWVYFYNAVLTAEYAENEMWAFYFIKGITYLGLLGILIGFPLFVGEYAKKFTIFKKKDK